MKRNVKKFLYGFITGVLLLCCAAGGIWLYIERPGFLGGNNYTAEINAAAARYGLPPALVWALIKKESHFNPSTIGKAGEIGLMQVLPRGAAAEWARVNKKPAPSDKELMRVKTNLDIGCWYLARAVNKWSAYRCKFELALAEYNAGAKNADRWKPGYPEGEILHKIDFPSTRQYVIDIMHDYRERLIQSKQ